MAGIFEGDTQIELRVHENIAHITPYPVDQKSAKMLGE
jgi:hypothetical protein